MRGPVSRSEVLGAQSLDARDTCAQALEAPRSGRNSLHLARAGRTARPCGNVGSSEALQLGFDRVVVDLLRTSRAPRPAGCHLRQPAPGFPRSGIPFHGSSSPTFRFAAAEHRPQISCALLGHEGRSSNGRPTPSHSAAGAQARWRQRSGSVLAQGPRGRSCRRTRWRTRALARSSWSAGTAEA